MCLNEDRQILMYNVNWKKKKKQGSQTLYSKMPTMLNVCVYIEKSGRV